MTAPQATPPARARQGLVDCDVHVYPRRVDEVKTYLPMPWRDRYQEGVYKGSITGNIQDPGAAARAIERWAGHPHFVQVMTDSGAHAPFGQRQYSPIYAACVRHGLRFAIHPGTEGMGLNVQPSPGYPTHYIEWPTCLARSCQAHLVSFLTEGVSWLPALMWRLDAEWKALLTEAPWLTKAPSADLRDHVRLSSQLLETPDNSQHLLQVFEMMDAAHIRMCASDYPHWDFDSPTHALPKLPEDLHRRSFSETAREWYGLA